MQKVHSDIAVALQWDGEGAPTVTASGRGEIAEKIIEIARQNGVPLQENTDLVEVLATLELGERIPPALYIAVAEVIAFAYQVRGNIPAHLKDKASTEIR